MFRIGIGYDVHRLVEGRDLILGGVQIPHSKGLLGYSDADVLIHAIMDAIFGALALGDIGKHFPDTDEKYENADSRVLLRCVNHTISELGYKLNNLDSTICAQEPRLADFIEAMRINIAKDLITDPVNVSIKATTEEGLGISGSMDGITAYAVVTLIKK